MARFSMASLALAAIVLFASPATGAENDVPDDLEYARITLYLRHSHNRTQTLGHSISGASLVPSHRPPLLSRRCPTFRYIPHLIGMT